MDTQFHNMTLLHRCGSGAYGEVWLCRDVTGQLLALKRIPKDKQIAELKGITALRQALPAHPNVLTIHHVAEDEACLWYTMDAADNLNDSLEQYLPDTLENRMHKGMTVDPVQVMQDLIAGVTALHSANIVHRDIKPGNVLFIKGHAVLGDVGLAAACTTSLSLAGTLGFLPPEVRDGSSSPGTVGKAGDLYALGMVLYCMITGNEPESFPSVPTGIALTPKMQRLNRLVCRMCDHNASSRLTSEKTLLKDFEKIVRLGDRAETLWEKMSFYRRRIIAVLCLLLFIGICIAGFILIKPYIHIGKHIAKPAADTKTADYPGKSKTKLYHHKRYPISMQIPAEWILVSQDTLKQIIRGKNDAENQELLKRTGLTEQGLKMLEQLVANGAEMLVCDLQDEFCENVTINIVQDDFSELCSLNDDEVELLLLNVRRQVMGKQTVFYTFHRSSFQGNTMFTIELSSAPNTLRQKEILLIVDNKLYEITLYSLKENYPKHVQSFDAMIKTIAFDKPAAGAAK